MSPWTESTTDRRTLIGPTQKPTLRDRVNSARETVNKVRDVANRGERLLDAANTLTDPNAGVCDRGRAAASAVGAASRGRVARVARTAGASVNAACTLADPNSSTGERANAVLGVAATAPGRFGRAAQAAQQFTGAVDQVREGDYGGAAVSTARGAATVLENIRQPGAGAVLRAGSDVYDRHRQGIRDVQQDVADVADGAIGATFAVAQAVPVVGAAAKGVETGFYAAQNAVDASGIGRDTCMRDQYQQRFTVGGATVRCGTAAVRAVGRTAGRAATAVVDGAGRAASAVVDGAGRAASAVADGAGRAATAVSDGATNAGRWVASWF